MTGTLRAAALAVVGSALAGATVARAQTQPPPFDGQAPARAAAQAPRPAPPPPPAPTAPPPAQASKPDAPPPAPTGSDDEIDDPKVSRRLGPRINVPPPPAPAPARPPIAPPRAPVLPPSPPRSEPVAPLPPAPPSPEAETATPTIARPYPPEAEGPFRPSLPRLKLALRRFTFVRIGASQSADGIAAPEAFNDVGIDVYPVSSAIRIGLSTAFGWQSGTFLLEGDYFATQSFSFGGQYRDLGRVVPFAEAFVGVGYMRRLQFDRTIPTAFWQFGTDAGVEIYVARTGYLSVALGYLRPVNGFAVRQQFTSVFVDTWSLKLGIGI